ncbi:hypothetical protein E2C01_100724 [Portunus trituberculatus]|uniref:Uncharacterized protein n=1 Tax=Portunus trituberculatus TaxID=210409 RepID=A0A5B7KDR6_PORTR|nr:hypothetical protein [Portunus trituberculatus]
MIPGSLRVVTPVSVCGIAGGGKTTSGRRTEQSEEAGHASVVDFAREGEREGGVSGCTWQLRRCEFLVLSRSLVSCVREASAAKNLPPSPPSSVIPVLLSPCRPVIRRLVKR